MPNETRWLCPVWGLELPQACAETVLSVSRDDGGEPYTFVLREMSDAERGDMEAALEYLPITGFQVHSLRAALELSTPPIFGNEPIRTAGLVSIGVALSIFVPSISIPHCFLLDAKQPGISWTSHEPMAGDLPPQSAAINLAHVGNVRAITHVLVEHFSTVSTAALRFYWAGHYSRPLDAVVDYVISAESILCRGIRAILAPRLFTRRRGERLLALAVSANRAVVAADV